MRDDDGTVIRRIRPGDSGRYRDIRLKALQDAPYAFGSTYEVEATRRDDEWADRVASAAAGAQRAMFLAFHDGSCVGLAGGVEDDLGADRQLVSMWVAPTHRGTGIAAGLVEAVLAWARDGGARTVALWVTRGNDRAQRF
jgi:GNAT superfamily N-acetyltransferase